MEAEPFEPAAFMLLESAIGDPRRRVGFESCHAVLHNEWRIPDGNPRRQIAIVRQHRAAVAGTEDVGNDLDAMRLAEFL